MWTGFRDWLQRLWAESRCSFHAGSIIKCCHREESPLEDWVAHTVKKGLELYLALKAVPAGSQVSSSPPALLKNLIMVSPLLLENELWNLHYYLAGDLAVSPGKSD